MKRPVLLNTAVRSMIASTILLASVGRVVAEEMWELQDSTVSVSLRGICTVSDTCCWASGAKGTVVLTIDGGSTWRSVGPPNLAAADFRDVHAWNEQTAIVMSAGDVDRLYRTENGGQSWTIVYEDPNSAAFFDGIAFDESGKNGWLMGDPIDGRVQLLTTQDTGKMWTPLPMNRRPVVPDGIAAFAASGTHLVCLDSATVMIGLGGRDSKSETESSASVLKTTNQGNDWHNVSVPIQSGLSSGVFSIAPISDRSGHFVLVGGDYQKIDQAKNNIAISEDSGESWRLPQSSGPAGFRSVVVSVIGDDGKPQLIATGPSGTDRSVDGGESWTAVSGTGFHTMSFVSSKIGWAAGSDGRIARWNAAN